MIIYLITQFFACTCIHVIHKTKFMTTLLYMPVLEHKRTLPIMRLNFHSALLLEINTSQKLFLGIVFLVQKDMAQKSPSVILVYHPCLVPVWIIVKAHNQKGEKHTSIQHPLKIFFDSNLKILNHKWLLHHFPEANNSIKILSNIIIIVTT